MLVLGREQRHLLLASQALDFAFVRDQALVRECLHAVEGRQVFLAFRNRIASVRPKRFVRVSTVGGGLRSPSLSLFLVGIGAAVALLLDAGVDSRFL